MHNLVRREGSSFFLQEADGRFYYKGADRWAAVEDDRLIGGLWANMSEGRCRFVMVKDKRWEGIEEQLK